MNLQRLEEQIKKYKNLEVLREILTERIDKQNAKLAPNLRNRRNLENDINTCLSFIGEIEKRIGLIREHTKKAEGYMKDVEEYMFNVIKRGVPLDRENPEVKSTSTKDRPAVVHSQI